MIASESIDKQVNFTKSVSSRTLDVTMDSNNLETSEPGMLRDVVCIICQLMEDWGHLSHSLSVLHF